MQSFVWSLLVWFATVFTVIVSNSVSAVVSNPELPQEIRYLTDDDRSEPPQTTMPLGPAYGRVPDTTVAVVWLKYKALRKGGIKNIQVIYSQWRNLEFEERAADTLMKSKIDPPKEIGLRPFKTQYHKVVFMKMPSDSVPAPPLCSSIDSNSVDAEFEKLPQSLKWQSPVYPKEAIRNGHRGTVWVKSLIDCDGAVRVSMIHRSSGHTELDAAALEASFHNTFSPGYQKGKAVTCWATYRIDFSL